MTNKAMVLALVAGLAFASGCKSEIDDKTAAKVSEPSAVEETEEEPKAEEAEEEAEAEPRVVDISVEDSSIGWVGAKVTGDHTGGFNKWSGKITEKGGTVEKLEFTVDTTSVFSDTEKLTGHLKSEDFFHVEKYPKATFVSKKIVEKEGEAPKGIDGEEVMATTHEITGDFTIRGVTKQLTFPATITVNDAKIDANTEFTFDRFDFGISYKGKADDLIRKEVLLKIALVAPYEQAEKAEKVEKAEEVEKAEAETGK